MGPKVVSHWPANDGAGRVVGTLAQDKLVASKMTQTILANMGTSDESIKPSNPS